MDKTKINKPINSICLKQGNEIIKLVNDLIEESYQEGKLSAEKRNEKATYLQGAGDAWEIFEKVMYIYNEVFPNISEFQNYFNIPQNTNNIIDGFFKKYTIEDIDKLKKKCDSIISDHKKKNRTTIYSGDIINFKYSQDSIDYDIDILVTYSSLHVDGSYYVEGIDPDGKVYRGTVDSYKIIKRGGPVNHFSIMGNKIVF